jgi:hypothetical protein
LTRVKIRRLDGGDLRYAEAFSDHPLIFPDPAAITPGKPLVIAEGEFDALLLAQLFPEASVITLGSVSARSDPAVLSKMLRAPRWYTGLDADQAGDSAASKFPSSAVRVRPPEPHTDWTEAAQAGINLRRWWKDRLTELKNQAAGSSTKIEPQPSAPRSSPAPPPPAASEPDQENPESAAEALLAEGHPADEVQRALTEYLQTPSGSDLSETDQAAIESCGDCPKDHSAPAAIPEDRWEDRRGGWRGARLGRWRDARLLLPPFPVLGISVDHLPAGRKIVHYELVIRRADRWLPWHCDLSPPPLPPSLGHAESIRRIAEWNRYFQAHPLGSPAGPPIYSAEQLAAAKPPVKVKRKSHPQLPLE